MTDRIALARAWWTFRPNGLATLGFLAARVAIVPWRQLDPELRNMHGRVLSLGCGFGIVERYLVQVCPDAQVEGFELDAERVLAAAKSSHLEPRVTVRHQDILEFADGEVFDSVLAVDVFHHIPSTKHADVASALFRALRPGGTFLLKDIDTVPSWKHRFNQWHDRIVTGEFSIDARPRNDMAEVCKRAGLMVDDVRPVGRFSPYPHYLLRARRPG